MLVKMRTIRWTYGYSRVDRIRNEVVRYKVKVAFMKDKMRETKLIWFGHVKIRSVDVCMRRCKSINLIECRGGRGPLKKSFNELFEQGLKFLGLTKEVT